jgi:hypothetical protein
MSDYCIVDPPIDASEHVQTVVGGEGLSIYYVTLTATCRNCAVTPEVNFPLLQLEQHEYPSLSEPPPMTPIPPEEEEDENEDATAGSASPTTARPTTARPATARPATARPTTPRPTTSRPTTASPTTAPPDQCTCPVDYLVDDKATYRRNLLWTPPPANMYNQYDEDLWRPPPNGPTAEQFLQAMNQAIEMKQEEDDVLERIVGLVQLVEPDYFNGEKPPFQPAAPTVTASPSQASTTPRPTTPRPTNSPLTRPPATPEPQQEQDREIDSSAGRRSMMISAVMAFLAVVLL